LRSVLAARKARTICMQSARSRDSIAASMVRDSVRVSRFAMVLLAATAWPALARAEDPAPVVVAPGAPALDPELAKPSVPDPYAAFPLATAHDKHYIRGGLEVFAILGLGLVDYSLNTVARGGVIHPGDRRWSISYDWPTLREKLIGTGLNLDTDRFQTNYIAHPLAGTSYFSVARSNHLSFAESYLYAIVGSTTWEYFGEIRLITSINDLVVTPTSGAAIGEPLMQLSGFFQHATKSFSSDALSFLFSPINAVNTWTDGATPLRSAHPDALGLPTETWHRFTVAAGAGVTVQAPADATHPRAAYVDQRFGLDLRLANLPGYGGAGKESRLYDDGNMSSLRFDATMSRGKLVDGVFATRVVPVGFYVRDARVDDAGGAWGSGGIVGWRLGFEYSSHLYDRDGRRPNELLLFSSPIGVAAEHVLVRGDLQLKTSLDIYGAIAGVTPYAAHDWLALHAPDHLLSPIRIQGYYHALAFTAAPGIELAYRGLRLGVDYRLDAFRPIRGVDTAQAVVDDSIVVSDRRSTFHAGVSYTIPRTPWRLGVDVTRIERSGDLGEVSVSRSEVSTWGTLGVVF
jgi:hypothetical protein